MACESKRYPRWRTEEERRARVDGCVERTPGDRVDRTKHERNRDDAKEDFGECHLVNLPRWGGGERASSGRMLSNLRRLRRV